MSNVEDTGAQVPQDVVTQATDVRTAPVEEMTVEKAREILGADRVLGPEVYAQAAKAYADRWKTSLEFKFDPTAKLPSKEQLEALKIRGATLAEYPTTMVYDGQEIPINLRDLVNLFPTEDTWRSPQGRAPVRVDRQWLGSWFWSPTSRGEVPGEYTPGWKAEGPLSDYAMGRYDQVQEYLKGTNQLERTGPYDVSILKTTMPPELPTVTEATMAYMRDLLTGRADKKLQGQLRPPLWTKTPGDRPNSTMIISDTSLGMALIPVDTQRMIALSGNVLPVRMAK